MKDKDLKHFEERLLKERARVLKELGYYDESFSDTPQGSDGDLSAYSFHMADQGTDAMEREKAALFASKEGRFLYHIDAALRRLYQNPEEFGYCAECGEPLRDRPRKGPRAYLPWILAALSLVAFSVAIALWVLWKGLPRLGGAEQFEAVVTAADVDGSYCCRGCLAVARVVDDVGDAVAEHRVPGGVAREVDDHQRHARAQQQEEQETPGGEVRIITDERTNSLVIMASRQRTQELRRVIDRLDVPVTGGGRIHVYYLEHANAEDLAETLNNMLGEQTGTAATGQQNQRTPQALRAAVTELSEGVTVTADAPTNSLVIQASQEGYRTLAAVIQQLDIARPQVLVEALIMEVAVTDGESLLDVSTFH